MILAADHVQGDYDLLGGLTNCLFDTPEQATAYAAATDQRVPEHAPFYGDGIYQLR